MSALALTGWDWFVIGALLISTLLGLVTGLVRTVFALVGWVAAFLAAPLLAPVAAVATGQAVPELLLMVLIFVIVLVVIKLAGVILARFLGKVGLGGLDRTLGAMLGVARALLVVAVVAVVARLGLQADHSEAWQRAQTRPLLDYLVMSVDPLLPEHSRSVKRI